MSDSAAIISKLLRDDPRYKFDAYILVFEALAFAQDILGIGEEQPSEELPGDVPEPKKPRKKAGKGREAEKPERHLTGQQLCEAIRVYSLEQYGLLARRVLNHMGVTKTGDFGEIVYNLIRIGQMRKTPADRREDFDDVYDFETAFDRSFQITTPKA